MELVNLANVPAMLTRTVVNETRMAAALVARMTYRIEKGNNLVPSEEHSWLVSAAPWNGPEGPMPSDEVLYRGGVDLFVFGKARAERGRPVSFVMVRVSCRGFKCQVLAIGDRVWTRKGVPSAPQPFVEMPLTMQQAYGGTVIWDGLTLAYPLNPEGKGFCMWETDAPGRALPNLESPGQLIQRWNDRPSPVGVGLCPPFFGPRTRESLVFTKEGALTEIRPTLFNAAFPAMVARSIEPDDTLAIEGLSFQGPLLVRVPSLPLRMRLTIGDKVAERLLQIDQIGVQVDKMTVFITYRYPFRYELNSRQLRTCELLFTEGRT
jgi:hypothetical protein